MNRFAATALFTAVVIILTAVSVPASVSQAFPLHPRNGSKMSGEATLASSLGPGGRHAVSVTIRLSGVSIPEAEFPAGVYAGGCRDELPGSPTWTLNPIKSGESRTVLHGQILNAQSL